MSNHQHNHSQGHTHHAGCSHGEQHYEEPDDYFRKLTELKQKSEEFYWMEILKGAVFAKKMESYGLSFVNSINVQVIQGVVGMAHMMLTCEWMPIRVRPFVSGMFWTLFFLLFVNYKIITGFGSPSEEEKKEMPSIDRKINEIVLFLPLLLFVITALRTSGKVNSSATKKKAQKVLEVRPYLENPNFSCKACEIPKAFRAMHCPMCKQCTPKFSRHSLVFGVCIGAANELIAMVFFLSLGVSCGYFLYKFTLLHSIFGIITQIIFYALNASIFYMSLVEFFTLFIINFYFGVTEFEIQGWQMLQYLMKIPLREFQNSCRNGIVHCFKESLWAFIGIDGFESQFQECVNEVEEREKEMLREEVSNEKALEFPDVEEGKKYIVNWDRAFIYAIPQMPNHPRRKEIYMMMKIDEPKMIENFRLLKTFKKEIQEQNPEFNEFQIQQKAMMLMQQHMMKNPQAAMQGFKPPPEQQKVIQQQMLSHMKTQFKNDGEIYNNFCEIERKLKDGEMNTDEAGFAIREIQQKIMQIKMQAVLKMQQEKEKAEMLSKQSENTKSTDLLETNHESTNSESSTSLQSLIQSQILKKLSDKQKKEELIEKESDKKEDESDILKEEIVDEI